MKLFIFEQHDYGIILRANSPEEAVAILLRLYPDTATPPPGAAYARDWKPADSMRELQVEPLPSELRPEVAFQWGPW